MFFSRQPHQISAETRQLFPVPGIHALIRFAGSTAVVPVKNASREWNAQV